MEEENKKILRIPEGTKRVTHTIIHPYKETLEEVYIPSSVEIIEEDAFNNCKALKKIEMVDGLKEIGNTAFWGCESLKEINIPKTVEKIGLASFGKCFSLNEITVDEENPIYTDLDSNAIVKKYGMELNALGADSEIPQGVKIIANGALVHSKKEEIVIPEGVEQLEEWAIELCENLKRLYIPSSVEILAEDFLMKCPNLETIKIDEKNKNYKDLGCNAVFDNENRLLALSTSTTRIPEGCKEILPTALYWSNIEELHIPSTVEHIFIYSDSNLPKLNKITVSKDNKVYSDGRDYVANGMFENVDSDKLSCNCIIERDGNVLLKGTMSTIIPDKIEAIGAGAYTRLPIKEIKLPKSLKVIRHRAFALCEELEKIDLHEGIEEIWGGAFSGCKKLKELTIPKSVTRVETICDYNDLDSIKVHKDNENYADYGCNVVVDKRTKTLLVGCKNSIIPNEVENISIWSFSGTTIKELDIPENVQNIEDRAFVNCKELKRITLPKGLKYVYYGTFNGCTALEDKTFHYKTKISKYNDELVFGAKVVYENGTYHFKNLKNYEYTQNGFIGELEDGTVVSPNSEGEYIEISRQEALKKANKLNKLDWLSFQYLYKMKKWNQYATVPSYVVVERMPYEEIDLFYKDNNTKNWQKLIKASQFKEDNFKGALFALAHALGVFSENGKESEKATEFILNGILTDYKGEQLYSALGGFDVDNAPYNPEFAKFFMHNFNGFDFMILKEEGEEINLLSACHNNFKDVQKEYPEKKVITRNDRERLTPELAMQVLGNKQYENVKENAKKLAVKVGRLGYNQQQFETLQDWYLTAINIPKEDLAIVCKKDDEDEPITYEVLDKGNPLGAVIGTLTNCCQVVGGAGQKCVEYGMTQPNSTFIAFRQGERLIGQAWVWYDKETGQVTLDNIEVPDAVMSDLKRFEGMREGVIDCINRLGVNLVKSMNANFEEQGKTERVNKVTIGLGCNDFKRFLLSNYQQTKDIKELTGYGGYSDAKKEVGQVTVVELEKEKIVLKEKEKNIE